MFLKCISKDMQYISVINLEKTVVRRSIGFAFIDRGPFKILRYNDSWGTYTLPNFAKTLDTILNFFLIQCIIQSVLTNLN